MENLTKGSWFSEASKETGIAFSLQIKDKCHEEKTPFQTIEIYETTNFGYLMTIDGFVMLSSRDNFLYHEMMSHVPLLTHDNPKKVAIIGGGDCGTLQQVLQHTNVEQVTQIDIDERVTRLAEQYFPELCLNNNDKRATLLFQDGIEWIKQQAPESLDIVIVDSTDPIGPAEGLFNVAFYESCNRALKEDGILVHQSESPLIHQELLQSMHNAMKEGGFNQLLTYTFPQPVYPTGWWSATMASKGRRLNKFKKNALLETKYYGPTVHQGAISPLPMLDFLNVTP